MRFVLKLVIYLAILAIIGLLAYAVFSDLPAPRHEVILPVEAQ